MTNKITQNVILEGTEYIPQPGLRYEIAEGKWGVMRRPTAALVSQVNKLLEADAATDFEIVKLVLIDLPDMDEEDADIGMPSRCALDFLAMLRLIEERLTMSSDPLPTSDTAVEAQE